MSDALHESVASTVGRKEARKLRARRRTGNQMWAGFGMFGLIGWSVAVPMLIGVGIGVWLDHAQTRPGFSWTLALLLAGVGVGCLNAWHWVAREQRSIEREDGEDP
ncbi:MAG: AtpZ/AtpI family protein [Phycisphaerales bacterium]|nr:AtpZ/AtpI family protein [Phycisphaerales bacterium]